MRTGTPRSWRLAAVWALLTLVAAAALAWVLMAPRPLSVRAWFTPGPMSHGHHGIELACGACHTAPFGGAAALQKSCVGCHGEQLRLAEDTHPRSKFTDPHNADLAKKLDGRVCLSCHVEHRPEITGAMGVSLPADFCVTCHAKVGEQRASHAGLGFDTCDSAGCHNYHDNRALYGEFLVAHAGEPDLLERPRLPVRDFGARWKGLHPAVPATRPDHSHADTSIAGEWRDGLHARAGVQCSGCHAAGPGGWSDKPGPRACESCHGGQVQGFLSGKHGMPLAVGLSPMQPGDSRLPMREDARHRELGCGSCHAAHGFEVRKAAVEACLGCHADRHSLAYRESKHFALWQQQQAGAAPGGSGVSCASCHLPRIERRKGPAVSVDVEHNQNLTLRPGEAMIRPVCQQCHGLAFAIDALADPELVQSNFQGQPTRHVPSIDMALQHADAARARRRPDATGQPP